MSHMLELEGVLSGCYKESQEHKGKYAHEVQTRKIPLEGNRNDLEK